MNKLATIEEVWVYINSKYIFNQENYPKIPAEEPARKAFIVNHSLQHMCKSTGKIAAEVETFDHGGQMNNENLKEATVKMFINTLKLASELGINTWDLMNAVPDYMKSK